MQKTWAWTASLSLHVGALGLALFVGARAFDTADETERPLIVLRSGVTRVESAASNVSDTPRSFVKIERKPPRDPRPREVGIARRSAIPSTPRPEVQLAVVEASPPYAEFDVPPLPAESPARVAADDPPLRPRMPHEPPPPLEAPNSSAASSVAADASSGAVDQGPSPLPGNPLPAYPRDAFRAGIEGTVMLRVVVGVDGRADSVTLEATSGNLSLDHAAIRTVRDQWRFRPARRGGQFVSYTVYLPVRFDHPSNGS